VYAGERLTVYRNGRRSGVYSITLDTTKAPPVMYRHPAEPGGGSHAAYIYKLEGEKLTVCTMGGAKPPRDFEPDHGLLVQVFKRKRP
jgi:uncharacterized protein (TIGR03067 family)